MSRKYMMLCCPVMGATISAFVQLTQYELILNLKAAKALGLKIPEPILLRADEVIR